MQIKIFRDLNQYTLTSSLKKADIELVKKYRPDALKVKDEEGNDVFAMSYVEDRPYVGSNGVTFGSATTEGGYAMIVGELPKKLPEGTATIGDYVADAVGSALVHINMFEDELPAVIEAITGERSALIESIVVA